MSDQHKPRTKTKTSAEIEALLREGAGDELRRGAGASGGRIARDVAARVRGDSGLRRRAGGPGLEAWVEDEGRIPRWFIGAAAAAVVGIVAWIALAPAPPRGTTGVGEGRTAESGSEFDGPLWSPDRLMHLTGGAEQWADAEPLRREARALMGVAGELAGRVISGVPQEFLRIGDRDEASPTMDGST